MNTKTTEEIYSVFDFLHLMKKRNRKGFMRFVYRTYKDQQFNEQKNDTKKFQFDLLDQIFEYRHGKRTSGPLDEYIYILEIIKENFARYLEFCEMFIAYTQMPQDQREECKKRFLYELDNDSQEEATLKQLFYIQGLGCDIKPKSKKEASNLIEILLFTNAFERDTKGIFNHYYGKSVIFEEGIG